MDNEAKDSGQDAPARRRALDALALEFPTDTVTVRQLIEHFPDSFQWNWERFGDLKPPLSAIENLLDTMHMERELAELALSSTSDAADVASSTLESVSRPGRSSQVTRKDLVDMLAEHYLKLGIANGRAETEERVRGFESAARALAQDGPAV